MTATRYDTHVKARERMIKAVIRWQAENISAIRRKTASQIAAGLAIYPWSEADSTKIVGTYSPYYSTQQRVPRKNYGPLTFRGVWCYTDRTR